MANDNPSRTVLSSTFILSFPNLLTPKQYQGKGDPFFSMEMIFDTPDLEKFRLWNDESGTFEEIDIKRLLVELAKEKWPDINVKEAVVHGGLFWPVKNGDKHADGREAKGKKNNDHYRGMSIINAKSSADYPPRLYYMDGKLRRQVDRVTDAGKQVVSQKFYGGAKCFAELNVVAQETPQGKYLSFYVNAVRFVKDGERLGGMSAMDRFDGIHGGESDYDPTDGMSDEIDDDEIPF